MYKEKAANTKHKFNWMKLIWFMCDAARGAKQNPLLAIADGQRPHRRYLDSDKSDSNRMGVQFGMVVLVVIKL